MFGYVNVAAAIYVVTDVYCTWYLVVAALHYYYLCYCYLLVLFFCCAKTKLQYVGSCYVLARSRLRVR